MLVVPVARLKQRRTPTATLVLLAPTRRLVDSCVPVVAVAVLPVTLWPQQAASPVTVQQRQRLAPQPLALAALAVNCSIRLAASYQPGRVAVVLVAQSLPATCRTPAVLVAAQVYLRAALLLPLATLQHQVQVWVVPAEVALLAATVEPVVPVEHPAVAAVAAVVLSTHSLPVLAVLALQASF